jgi:hypothetical protein
MALLNENAQTIQLFAFLLMVVSLWKNPLGWRLIRQSRGGIFHRLRAALCRPLVLACAWWYSEVVWGFNVIDPVWHFVDRFFPGHGYRVGNFIEQKLLPLILGGWLVWPVAKSYLQAKWQAENAEFDRLHAYDYWQAKQQPDEGKKP